MTVKTASEIHGPGWAMALLASPLAPQKCQLGIPDTIVFEQGTAEAWLFTSKTGEILRKRSMQSNAIRDRFLRLAATNPHHPQRRVAIMRYSDGTVQTLGQKSFKDLMHKFPPTEPGLLSVQCFIQSKGLMNTIWRNSYSVVDDKGRIVTGTASFTTLSQGSGGSSSSSSTVATPITAVAPTAGDGAEDQQQQVETEEPTAEWHARDVKPVRSTAARTNAALDAATRVVVRHLESALRGPGRVLHLECDYAVDAADQLWLMWIGSVTLATGDAAQDLRLADVQVEGLYGRAGFLGAEAARTVRQAPPKPMRSSSSKLGKSAAAQAQAAAADAPAVIARAVCAAAETVELRHSTSTGSRSSSRLGGATAAAAVNKNSSRGVTMSTALAVLDRLAAATVATAAAGITQGPPASTMTVMTGSSGTVAAASAGGETQYSSTGNQQQQLLQQQRHRRRPVLQACCGDYCSLRTADPREDVDDPRRAGPGQPPRALLELAAAAAAADGDANDDNADAALGDSSGLSSSKHSSGAFLKGVAMRLFSGEELSVLRRDATFRRQIAEGKISDYTAAAAAAAAAASNAASAGAAAGVAGAAAAATAGAATASAAVTSAATAASGYTSSSSAAQRQPGSYAGRHATAGGARDRREGTDALSDVVWRSVVAARTERRLGTEGDVAATWPGTSTTTATATSAATTADDTAAAATSVMKGTEASAARLHLRRREEAALGVGGAASGAGGGAQSAYRTVKVCATCFQVSSLSIM
jgi:trimeric autotransporter adhesin